MAALQTLRNKPALLMSVIGGALLLFIVTLTDLNSCSRPNIEAEVNGKELTYEAYEQQVQNEENLESLLTDNLTDETRNNIRQTVWQKFEQGQVLGQEAEKLGLSASKEDVQNELSNVTPQQLQQIAQALQYGQMTMSNVGYAQKIMLLMAKFIGQPSVEGYKQFMKTADQQIAQMQKQDPNSAELIASIKQACLYCESQMPLELTINKYMGLMAQGFVSNPVAAKMDFEEGVTSCNMEIASVPYSTVDDKDIKITDEDLKNKYKECKEMFRLGGKSLDIKLINVEVAASAKDQAAIMAQVQALEDTLRKVNTIKAVADVMRGAKSDVNYTNAYLPKEAYTQSDLADVVSVIDSLSVGGVMKTKVEARDRTGVQYISTYKLVAAKTTPDSMQICQLAVDGKALADSIVAAVKAGSTLSAEAKKHNDVVQKYGLKGDTTWNATKYYVDANTALEGVAEGAYTDICQIPAGTTAYYVVPNQQTGQPIYVVTTVLSTKAPSAKYNVAIVKYPIKFTQETYNNKQRALSEFLAKNRTIAEIEKNASKAGYMLIDRANFSTSDAMTIRYNIGGEGVRDAFIWAFDEAEAGAVSRIYPCGKDNDQFLVLCVTGKNDGDYLEWNNANVKRQLELLVKQDKKAEKILASVQDVKDMEAAKKVKDVDVTNQPVMGLSQMTMYEPALAGAVERTENGNFTGTVKGKNAIYMVQVNAKTQGEATYNEKLAMLSTARASLGKVFGQTGNIVDALMKKAEVTDKRYKF